MQSPIDRLEGQLWDSCVDQFAAGDEATRERWENNPVTYWKEGFRVRPLPDYLEPLIEPALARWSEIEDKVFSNLQMSREQFLEQFDLARANFRDGGSDWNSFAQRNGRLVYGAVRNMDVLNMFAWVLPSADAKRREELRRIGRAVVAIFYTERLGYDSIEPPDPNDSNFLKLELRWQELKEDSAS